jgi:hypothetical protein
MLGLDWLPISRQSLRPYEISRHTGSPFLSRSALVATVVPIRIDLIYSVGIGSPLFNSILVTEERIRLMPSVGASS